MALTSQYVPPSWMGQLGTCTNSWSQVCPSQPHGQPNENTLYALIGPNNCPIYMGPYATIIGIGETNLHF